MRITRRIAVAATAVLAAGAGLFASPPLASAQTPGEIRNFFGYCLSANGPIVVGTGITAAVANCSSSDPSQQFLMSSGGLVYDESGFCLGVLGLTPGTVVASDFSCSNTNAGDIQWQYDNSQGGLLELQADPFLCLSSTTPGNPVTIQTCQQVASQTVAWQIPTASIAEWSPNDVARTIAPGGTGEVYLSLNATDTSFTANGVTFGAPSTFAFTGATSLPAGCSYALPNGSGGFGAITCTGITDPGGNYFQGAVQVVVSPTAPQNTLLLGTSSFTSSNGPDNGNTFGSFAVATSPLLDLSVAGLTLVAGGLGWGAWWLRRQRRRRSATV